MSLGPNVSEGWGLMEKRPNVLVPSDEGGSAGTIPVLTPSMDDLRLARYQSQVTAKSYCISNKLDVWQAVIRVAENMTI